MNLVQAFVFAIQNWIFIPWRPSLVFNKKRFIYHFNFGYKLTISGLIDTIYNDLYRIVIGKSFSPTQVGYFNQAETMRLFPVQQISTVMGKVTYPFFAKIKTDERLKEAYKITMKLVLFVVIPVMLFLIVIAREGFLFVFGEHWLSAVPYFQILALASIIRPISSYNLNILKVKGRSDLFLKVEIIKKIVGLMALVVGYQFGVMGLVISLTSVSFLWTLINMHYCGVLINYKVFEQIKDIAHLFIFGIVSLAAAHWFKKQFLFNLDSLFWIIFLVGIVYVTIYITLVLLLDRALIKQVMEAIRNV